MRTLIGILLIAWLAGLLLSITFGGLIALLPIAAAVLAIASTARAVLGFRHRQGEHDSDIT